MRRIVIVSNRLPVSVKRTPAPTGSSEPATFALKQSVGGLATGLAGLRDYERLWIGWPGEVVTDPREQEIVRSMLKEQGLVPVFLSKHEVNMFYSGFSNKTLWPHFHYFTQFTSYANEYFDWYQSVNDKFKDAVFEQVSKDHEESDMIWIHDYQLLMVPAMIRDRFHNVGIGFFLHIPFPSYETFRTLPWRKALLTGMLGADCIGFHTVGYLRHFISAVSRICGIDFVHNRLQVGNRVVSVGVYPMGIDYDTYAAQADTGGSNTSLVESPDWDLTLLKEKGMKIIISVDRLDYTKGIPSRIRAYKRFLEEYPNYKAKVTLIQIVVPCRDNVEEYKDLRDEIETLISKVSGEYDTLQWSAIHYASKPFPTSQLIPMYRHADVCLVTPLRDGMNLVAKEYVAAKEGIDTGVLILSEMAGAADELVDSIIVNPNDESDIVTALMTALEMPVDEQKRRLESLQSTVRTYTVQVWKMVKICIRLHRLEYFKSFNSPPFSGGGGELELQIFTIFLVWANVFIKSLLEAIETNQQNMSHQLSNEPSLGSMLEVYKRSQHRLLLLDYDGTLMSFHRNPAAVKPDQWLTETLKKLCASPKNQVVVISGRDKITLNEWLGNEQKLDFASEHGVWLRRNEEWKCLLSSEQTDLIDVWKMECREIMGEMCNLVPGTFVEEKHSSIAWHFRGVENNVAQSAIRKYLQSISTLASKYHLQLLEGNRVIELKSKQVNKGKAADDWLQCRIPGDRTSTRATIPKEAEWDFILAIGDDSTDEDTFQAANAADMNAYTVKVGGLGAENTAARYTLSNVKKVRLVLTELVKLTNQESYADHDDDQQNVSKN
ncbi:hypothetical protein ACOME3_002138 [Neoechinorhynchus agilis]